ncbi:MAG: SpoIIE family protein phosphatase [Oscillospiraceae bacterium]
MIKENKTEKREDDGLNYTIKKHKPVRDSYSAAAELSEMSALWEKGTIRFAAAAAGAFLLTKAEIGGIHSPMSVSFCAVLGAGGNAAALPGMLISCILFGTLAENITELAAAFFMLIVKLFTSHRFSVKGGTIFSSAVYFGFGSLYLLYCGFSLSALAAVIFRTAVCGSAAYIFGRAAAVPYGDNKAADPVPAFICGIIFASALCGINVYLFNLGRIAVIIAAAVFAKKYGCCGGAAAGAAGAAAMILCDSYFSRSAVFIVIAALSAGLSAHRGRLAVSLTLIFTSLVLTVIVGIPSGAAEYVADSAVAGLLYFIIPERLYSPCIDKMDRQDRGESRHIDARLKFSAAVLEEVGSDIAAARRIYDGKECEHDIAAAVRIKVCSKCHSGEYAGCDECSAASEDRGDNSPLENAARIVLRKGILTEKELPTRLTRCTRKTELIKCFNREVLTEERRRYSERLSGGICAASLEQLKAQRIAYENMGSGGLRYNGRLSVIASDALRSFDIGVRSAAVYFDRSGRAYAEAFIIDWENIPFDEMTDRLSSVTGMALDIPLIERAEGEKNILRCRWCRVPEFIADVGIRSAAGGREKSGDYADYFRDGFGKLYIILSDGMGSGQRAAEESCMAVSVIKRFIRSGAGVEAAVYYANLLLAGVSSDEIFTTADIMELDSYTGKCTFYKQGAAESYIRCGDEVVTAENRSLPVGILPETSISPVSFYLKAGDGAVMISDGVSGNSDYIREILMNDTITSEMCAEKIIASALSDERRKDDKTAAAVKLYAY